MVPFVVIVLTVVIVPTGKITGIYDQSDASTKTKYIKLNTKTQIFKITFDFCIHFKRENFFSPFVFLSKCIKKSSNFHLNDKKYFGF